MLVFVWYINVFTTRANFDCLCSKHSYFYIDSVNAEWQVSHVLFVDDKSDVLAVGLACRFLLGNLSNAISLSAFFNFPRESLGATWSLVGPVLFVLQYCI